MDDRTEKMLDRALADLARDVDAGTPRPSPDLVARVLAEAAEISPPRPAPAPQDYLSEAIPVTARPQAPGLMDRLFGWTGGAVATLSVCLALGIGLGLSLEASEMPVLGEAGEELAMIVEGDGMAEDIL